MVLVLGVSAGAGGAHAVLTHSDQPHLPPIDYCHVPLRRGAGVEEPVFTAIQRMRTAAGQRDELITATAVTCRSERHADAVRAAAGRIQLTIVDEPLAQLRYLRFTGALTDEGVVALYDLGSSGLTLTLVDCRTDSILLDAHSVAPGGDNFDTLLCRRLAHEGVRIDQATSRRHREALGRSKVITATDLGGSTRTVVTHNDLAELFPEGLRYSAELLQRMIEKSQVDPEALVLLGGCARNLDLRIQLAEIIDLPIVYDAEPEYVSARGAVLIAAERPVAEVRMARSGTGIRVPPHPSRVDRRKLVAAAAVTLGLGATVAGLLTAQDGSAQPGDQPRTARVVGIPADPGR
ncbi:hypothetical protein [Nocardia paucivorans]|uniref:hypothetical protein n=1 Tax=Nocardia paucivorans TaxID=114259 RepID=UPI00031D0348|nr:hypothetical protein [Nocardia paucivorans]